MTTLRSWNSEELKRLNEEIQSAIKDKEVDDILYKLFSWRIFKYFGLAVIIISFFYFVFKVSITKEVMENSRLDEYYQLVLQDTYDYSDSITSRYSVMIADTLANKNFGFKITINFKEK